MHFWSNSVKALLSRGLFCALLWTQIAIPCLLNTTLANAAKAEPTAKPKTLRAVVQITTGTLTGFVRDGFGGGLENVSVRAINVDTGNPRATKTNLDGFYQITALPLGQYLVEASKPGLILQPSASGESGKLTRVQLNKAVTRVPDIILTPPPVLATTPTTIPAPPTTPPGTGTPPPTTTTTAAASSIVNPYDATRSLNIDESQLVTLPLADNRTFDTLATLAAGVAPAPQVRGVAGPGIGAGIGTAGQFAVNGQRARSNNFTVDGSDNNDEDVGVRRQGFAALVPQSIESVQEVQTVTSLWDAEAGRNVGAQINAVSKSGTNKIHGTLYDFFNHDRLNARNFFDYTSDKTARYALTTQAQRGFSNGNPIDVRTLPVSVSTNPFESRFVTQANPSLGQDQFQRNQLGGVIGFPLRKDRTFFFGSFERQDSQARQEQHFAVPTVAQRGFLNFGASGFGAQTDTGRAVGFTPTFIAGDAVFSLFPFNNNPIGPYGENTYTQVLPADSAGTIFSAKVDHSFRALGKDHSATARYNFTNDERIVPSVGGALFSSLIPRVGTQNLSLFLTSQLSLTLTNQLRGSFGRTRLRFAEKRDAYLTPSQFLPNENWLLSARRVENFSTPEVPLPYVNYFQRTSNNADTELGAVGQVTVHPFSPVGLDVFLFPQARVNNTYQIADTLSHFRNDQTWKYGFDIRRTQLNSFLNRNYRPQITFGGGPDLTSRFAEAPIARPSQFGPTPGYFSGTDLAALGLPTSISQALALGNADSTVALRLWQLNFFVNDNWRIRRGLTLDLGLRYELNTVPTEANGRIERTFGLAELPANDPNLRVVIPFTNGQSFNQARLLNSFNNTLTALRDVLGGRTNIYDGDHNNVAPRAGLAWDPLAHSRTQAGKTVVRLGFGLHYDLNLGSVVSQSRNVFPTFVPVNVDANSFGFAAQQFFVPGESGTVRLINPGFVPLQIIGAPRASSFLIANGTLNELRLPGGVQQQVLGLLFDPGTATGGRPSGGGLAFTLPDKNLRAPYALQYNVQIERELGGNYLANLAFVGTKGNKLVRFRTPNGGPNSITLPVDPLGLQPNPILAIALPPLGKLDTARPTRPNAALGSWTLFDSSARSKYNALQASLTKRYAQGFQFTAAYTLGHAIDDVSDVFDVAGAFALAQDDRNLRAEAGDANFDIRHRFVWSLVSNLPGLQRWNSRRGATAWLLGNWQISALASLQTGQPFTVNTSYDVNLDGNLTDRLGTLAGLRSVNERQQRLALTARATSLLAPLGMNGQIGRNTFRAAGVAKTDFALFKNFRLRNEQTILFRVEAFNVFNRTHFALPVRILEAPSFGQSTETLFNARQIQFALKYIF